MACASSDGGLRAPAGVAEGAAAGEKTTYLDSAGWSEETLQAPGGNAQQCSHNFHHSSARWLRRRLGIIASSSRFARNIPSKRDAEENRKLRPVLLKIGVRVGNIHSVVVD